MRRLPPRTTAALALGTALAVSAPAFADNVGVTVTGLGGTRQFTVENLAGAQLTALNLGSGGAQPFRTHVQDAGFLPTSLLTGSYTVNAAINNLYLKDGSAYNYAVKIPSKDLSIGFGGSPLAGSGISLQDLPKLSLTATLASCGSLSSGLKTALGLQTISGITTAIDLTNTALTTLCTTLATPGVHDLAATVDGVVQNLVPALTAVADLPSALSGATGGTFTNPSFASGTVGAADPSASGTPATVVSLMTGTHNLSAGLIAALKAALTNALTGLPLVAAGVTPAATTLEAAVAALNTAADTLSNQLGAVLSTLSDANKISVLNGLGLGLTALDPVLANIKGITGSYFAFPVLKATPTTPVPGTYNGTMTVTFVQG